MNWQNVLIISFFFFFRTSMIFLVKRTKTNSRILIFVLHIFLFLFVIFILKKKKNNSLFNLLFSLFLFLGSLPFPLSTIAVDLLHSYGIHSPPTCVFSLWPLLVTWCQRSTPTSWIRNQNWHLIYRLCSSLMFNMFVPQNKTSLTRRSRSPSWISKSDLKRLSNARCILSVTVSEGEKMF